METKTLSVKIDEYTLKINTLTNICKQDTIRIIKKSKSIKITKRDHSKAELYLLQ